MTSTAASVCYDVLPSELPKNDVDLDRLNDLDGISNVADSGSESPAPDDIPPIKDNAGHPISPGSIDRTLAYRALKVDFYDRVYANKLREYFNNLDEATRNSFNNFTEGLMNETHINRYKLLEAIGHYERCIPVSSHTWTRFMDGAFNVRPYNGW